jgi:hypothetical protein
VAHVRTVKTASAATAVQIVYAKRRGARRMEHVGPGHDAREVEALNTAAATGGWPVGVDAGGAAAGSGPLPILASRIGHQWRVLCRPMSCSGSPRARAGTGCSGTEAVDPGAVFAPGDRRSAPAGHWRASPACKRHPQSPMWSGESAGRVCSSSVVA